MPKKRGARLSATTVTRFLVILGIIALLSGGALFLYHQRHNPTFVRATSRQPQTFTELYFTNAAQLPATASSGQDLPVSFTIHNMEARQVTYTYTVNFTTSTGHSIVLDRQSVTLPNGHAMAINDNDLSLPGYRGRGEVSVVLLDHPEAIHYWLEVS